MIKVSGEIILALYFLLKCNRLHKMLAIKNVGVNI